MRILGGFAIINGDTGKKIVFTYSETDENGIIIKSNQKGSYVVLEEEEVKLIKAMEEKIKIKLDKV